MSVRQQAFEPAVRDERSAGFFDGLRRGSLLIRRCAPYGHLSAPEVEFCAVCGSAALEWTAAGGGGQVISWTVIHSRPDPAGTAPAPVLAAIVELDEGPWLRARLMAADRADVRTGARVALEIVPGAGEPVYAFRLT